MCVCVSIHQLLSIFLSYFSHPLAPCLATRLTASRIHIGIATEIGGNSLGYIRAPLHAVPLLPGGGHRLLASAPRPQHLQHLDVRRLRLVRPVHRGSGPILSLCQGKSQQRHRPTHPDGLILGQPQKGSV